MVIKLDERDGESAIGCYAYEDEKNVRRRCDLFQEEVFGFCVFKQWMDIIVSKGWDLGMLGFG